MFVCGLCHQGSALWARGVRRQPVTEDRIQSVYSVDEAIDDSDKCAAAPSRINLQSEQEPTESRRRASAAVSFYNRDV